MLILKNKCKERVRCGPDTGSAKQNRQNHAATKTTFLYKKQFTIKFYIVQMCERKVWTLAEDQLLIRIMHEEGMDGRRRTLRWNQIATRINQLGCLTPRKGKQCRQRWFNQLHPDINKDQNWLPQEQETLFQLQGEHGNHWSKIAKGLPGRSDNNIKNYFYSSLRKALRKVNNYVYINKSVPVFKNIKPFQKHTLSKVLTVAEKKGDQKLIIAREEAFTLAQDIKNILLRVQLGGNQDQSGQVSAQMPEIVSKIQEFNRICKRKKSKKKGFSKRESHTIIQVSQEQEDEAYSREQISLEDVLSLNRSKLSANLDLNCSSSVIQKKAGSQNPQGATLKAHPRYSQSMVIEMNNQVKNRLVIPLCRSNGLLRPGQARESLHILKQKCFTAEELDNVGKQQEPVQSSFLPCIPTFHFKDLKKSSSMEKNQDFNIQEEFQDKIGGLPLTLLSSMWGNGGLRGPFRNSALQVKAQDKGVDDA